MIPHREIAALQYSWGRAVDDILDGSMDERRAFYASRRDAIDSLIAVETAIGGASAYYAPRSRAQRAVRDLYAALADYDDAMRELMAARKARAAEGEAGYEG